MTMVDPISDMLTRIRNAKKQNFATVEFPASRMKTEILKIMKREGYIRNYVVRKRGGHNRLKVFLKYTEKGEPSFDNIQRISRPGRRIYVDSKNIPAVAGGNGISILTTPRGVMTDKDARKQGVGGELLCRLW